MCLKTVDVSPRPASLWPEMSIAIILACSIQIPETKHPWFWPSLLMVYRLLKIFGTLGVGGDMVLIRHHFQYTSPTSVVIYPTAARCLRNMCRVLTPLDHLSGRNLRYSRATFDIVDVCKDGLTEEQIAVAQKPLDMSSGSEDVTTSRQKLTFLLLEVHHTVEIVGRS